MVKNPAINVDEFSAPAAPIKLNNVGFLVQKMVLFYEKQGMTTEEAVEWIDYNVMGVQCNGEGFIMMYEHIE